MNNFSWDRFSSAPLVAILRGYGVGQASEIAKALHAGGFKNIEVTMNSVEPEKQIALIKELVGNEMNVGAGTVCTLEDLDRALSAGAQFIITPIVVPEVIQACKAKEVPVFPGAFSPTEIYQAWSLGADIVKVFPARRLGAKYFKDVLGPLNQIKLMPTGGVDISTVADFIKAGASAISVGSTLIDSTLVKEKRWELLQQKAEAFLEALHSAQIAAS